MSQKRRKIDSQLKARVAIEAIRNEKTTAQIMSDFDVHSNQVSSWKKQLIDLTPGIFEDRRSKEFREKDFEKQIDELHRQLGKAQAEIEWLKKKSKQLGV